MNKAQTLDRYARQKLIQWWDQEKLQSARIMICGAGALGNEVLKNLALLGVGHLLIVDFDTIEYSNLSRSVLFQEKDVGCSKVDAAAKAIRTLNPSICVQTIQGDLFYDVGLGHFRHCDLAIGCLDSIAARSQVGQSCVLAGIPFLDGGMWSLGGEIRWFTAKDGPCFDCTLNNDDRIHANERRSCSGFKQAEWEDHVPTVISTSAVIGGILTQETAKFLCNYPIPEGKAIVYNGQTLSMHRSELTKNPQCLSSHTPYHDVIELNDQSSQLTPKQLFTLIRNEMDQKENLASTNDEFVLELGRDFLLTFNCSDCGDQQKMNQPLGQISENERCCPKCKANRMPEIIRSIEESSIYANMLLSDLGIPPAEVLAVQVNKQLKFYELTADINNL